MSQEKSGLSGSRSTSVEGRVWIARDLHQKIPTIDEGDFLLIEDNDLTQADAELLIESGVQLVINAALSVTGRVRSRGPQTLIDAGIVLLDDCGSDVWALKDGDSITVKGTDILREGKRVAQGHRYDSLKDLPSDIPDADQALSDQLQAFEASTSTFLEYEGAGVLRGEGYPELATQVSGRQVLLVCDSPRASQQLRDLGQWIRDTQPLVVAVEGGALRAKRAHLKPAIIVGDMTEVPDKIIRSGAEIVVPRAHEGDQGRDRLNRMGIDYHQIDLSASAQDVAISLLSFMDPAAIVVAGDARELEDYLEFPRSVVTPAFLIRLRAGDLLIPAHAVSATYRSRIRGGWLFLLACVLFASMGVALWATPWGHDLYMSAWNWISQLWSPSNSASSDLVHWTETVTF
ncbi:putative cytokinetic ring protein SteA [uncultured Actinomyces sp.]|uniref:putative cytokinetic ring protein SteA n=1 Tax=uncultured Actinomyces sp. TaxID=249061 RepID=UPI002637B319|nr:putative cytokinetic ring protein SteA [uncultured Actinomyces sp.]